MRFPVPQFIDVEDKMFGQLTAKQMAYLCGGGAFVFITYSIGGFFFAVIFGGPFALLALALAFMKINERPFYLMVYALFFYLLSSRLYLWKKSERVKQVKEVEEGGVQGPQLDAAPHLSQSRLKELAWSLDTKESMYSAEEQWRRK